EAANTFITKTNGGIIVIPKDHYVAERERLTIEQMINRAKSACEQCRSCTELCPRYQIGHPLHPHKIMRTMALGKTDEEVLKEAIICCQCGICEMYACPNGLSPRRINGYVKAQMGAKGIKWKNETDVFTGDPQREYRKVPTGMLITRLGMNKYKGQPYKENEELVPAQVTIPLKQGIGAPSTAVVKVGDVVKKGQMIGAIDEGKMGTNVHASIDGTVVEVNENVVIKAI
ncbi:4Fe-4S dicluster domain-containing protein, partial [Clostridium sp.]|uniref:4Fe-4S dicluster domain-containing protein n=1 Tax=Clostridium sp. TaxID=1506 RepID=UPI002FDDC9CB